MGQLHIVFCGPLACHMYLQSWLDNAPSCDTVATACPESPIGDVCRSDTHQSGTCDSSTFACAQVHGVALFVSNLCVIMEQDVAHKAFVLQVL